MLNLFSNIFGSSNDRILKKITDGEHAGQTFVKKGIRFIKNSAVKDFSININDGFFITEEKHKLQIPQKKSFHCREPCMS